MVYDVEGRIVAGDLERGLTVLLSDHVDVEDYPVGAFVKIVGKKFDFLAMIVNSRIEAFRDSLDFLASGTTSDKLKETLVSANKKIFRKQFLELIPIAKYDRETGEVGAADVLPSFYSPMVSLTKEDLTIFYGSLGDAEIGYPKTTGKIDAPLAIDLKNLIELSFGIFGKSGSGKTFLGNILAGYIVLYDFINRSTEKGVKLLIFDMQSEYGLELRDNYGNKIADGVGSIFKDFFDRYTPDIELADKRNLYEFRINLKELTIEDLYFIAPIFGVSQTFLEYLRDFYKLLKSILGDLWFLGFFEGEDLERYFGDDPDEQKILNELERALERRGGLAALRNIVLSAINNKLKSAAIRSSFITQTSKLKRILEYPFTLDKNPVDEIIKKLLDRGGKNIIISFGKYEREMPLYMLIANLIARRLWEEILEREAKGEEIGNKVIIFLEEAHNFLGRETYRISPFGRIAMEMRKKGVTLCVIDQKPAELDPDVISMLWTKIVFNLTDKRDIEQAVLGSDKPELFRKVVPTLPPREAFVYGLAIRHPTVLKILNYRDVANKFRKAVEDIKNSWVKKEEELQKHKLL